MRQPVALNVGQIWMSSDPRRLSWFTIEEIEGDDIIVRNGSNARLRTVCRCAFQVTGPRGYMRHR